MRNLGLLFTLSLIIITTSLKAGEDDEERAPLTHFSVEANHTFSGHINKHAINVGGYYWFNRTYMIGSEFYTYFPNNDHQFFDFQVDVNFRKYLVDWHPYAFFVLIGPAFRNYVNVDPITDSKNRVWNYDGINLGFGFNYRFKNHAIFVMPKINHKDAKFQIASGYRYHFNVSTNRIFNKRYKLRKKRKKD